MALGRGVTGAGDLVRHLEHHCWRRQRLLYQCGCGEFPEIFEGYSPWNNSWRCFVSGTLPDLQIANPKIKFNLGEIAAMKRFND